MLTHETANWAQSNMSERAKTDKFQTKLTQLLIARNIGVRGNLTKLYINILNKHSLRVESGHKFMI